MQGTESGLTVSCLHVEQVLRVGIESESWFVVLFGKMFVPLEVWSAAQRKAALAF
jgi:hypothetical protein